jgi:hypothetical protein
MRIGEVTVACETFLTDANECSGAGFFGTAGMETMNGMGLEFPVNDGFGRARVAADPGMDQSARRIDFEILALN